MNRLFHLNINVADLDRSIEFYSIFGFRVIHREALDEDTVKGVAITLADTPNASEYALIRIGDDPRSACIDLVQWKDRPTCGTPYEAPNHTGIFRFLIHVDDPEQVLADLRNAGHQPMGGVLRPDPARPSSPTTTMFCVRDPDGVTVEIAAGLDSLTEQSTVE